MGRPNSKGDQFGESGRGMKQKTVATYQLGVDG